MHDRTAPTDHPIDPAIAGRFSPRAFDGRPVPAADLRAMFEAARWAASSFNEQPWSFVVASREDGPAFERLLACANEFNRAWANGAPALALSVARTTFARNGKPNRHAWHDVGLATAQLMVEASARGLAVHAMGGFDAGAARETYGIPDGHEPVALLAIGYPADPAALPERERAAETAPRTRRTQSTFVFGRAWGEPATLGA